MNDESRNILNASLPSRRQVCWCALDRSDCPVHAPAQFDEWAAVNQAAMAFYAPPDPAEAPEPRSEPRTGLDALLVLVGAALLGVLCWYWPAAHGWFTAHAERWRAF